MVFFPESPMLKLSASTASYWAQSIFGELRSCKAQGMTKREKIKIKLKNTNSF